MKNRIRRYTRAYEVTIGTKSTTVHVESRDEAIDRAVTKLYGSRCFWFADSGLPGYGQVFESLRATKYNSNPGNSSRTRRVGIDVDPIGKPSRNFLKQQRADRTENARISEIMRVEDERKRRAHDAGLCGDPFPDFPGEGNIDLHWLRVEYQDGIRHREDWETQQRAEQQVAENREREEEQRQEHEYLASVEAEAWDDNREYNEHKQRVNAEVERLRFLPPDRPIDDPVLSAIARDVAVHNWIKNGRIGTMGDFKRSVVNGEHPELVREFLNSSQIFGRVDNVVE